MGGGVGLLDDLNELALRVGASGSRMPRSHRARERSARDVAIKSRGERGGFATFLE